MATATLLTVDPLEEAAAIVEAEWLRVRQDRAVSMRQVIDRSAEMPAFVLHRVRVRAAIVEQGSPGYPVPDDRSARRPCRRSAMRVWPTQRSPPPNPRELRKVLSDREVMLNR
jgi:hypothetical protein